MAELAGIWAGALIGCVLGTLLYVLVNVWRYVRGTKEELHKWLDS